MRKKFKLFALFFSCLNFAEAQIDLQNSGILYISGGTDTLYINGSFINASPASFTNNSHLYLKQNFTNNQASMAVGTGELILTGTAAQSISGTVSPGFYNFTINKTAGLVTLATGVIVNNSLLLTSGKISLGNNNFTIGATGSIVNASATNYIIAAGTGALIQQVNSSSSKLFPVGTSLYYTPASIGLSPTSVTDNLSVRVMDRVYSSGTTGNILTANAVNASWVISETLSGGTDASVTLQWPLALEMSGFNRGFSRMADYNSGSWNYGPSDIAASGSDPYTVSRSGFSSFSIFSVRSFGALPVQWLTINGRNDKSNNYIYWSTAAEQNNNYFVVEKSADGLAFSPVGQVAANRSGPGIQEYSFVHYDITTTINYYRIKQVDINGRYSYSKTIQIIAAFSHSNSIAVTPNPVKDKPVISVQLLQSVEGFFIISNSSGKIVYKQTSMIPKGNSFIYLSSFNQSAGIYWVTLTDDKGMILTAPMIIQ